MNRDEMVSRVRNRKEPWDIVVIGGGATGAGVRCGCGDAWIRRFAAGSARTLAKELRAVLLSWCTVGFVTWSREMFRS